MIKTRIVLFKLVVKHIFALENYKFCREFDHTIYYSIIRVQAANHRMS